MYWSELTECRSKYCVTWNGSLHGIPKQQPTFVLINTFFRQFLVAGLQTVPSTNFESGQIHHNLRIKSGIHHDVLHIFFHSSRHSGPVYHPSRRSEPILHPSRSPDYFSKSSPRKRWDKSCSQQINSIHFSWDLRHLLLDTNLTLLWCKRPLSSIHLVEHIQGRNLYVVINMTWRLQSTDPAALSEADHPPAYTHKAVDRVHTVGTIPVGICSLFHFSCSNLLLTLFYSDMHGSRHRRRSWFLRGNIHEFDLSRISLCWSRLARHNWLRCSVYCLLQPQDVHAYGYGR